MSVNCKIEAPYPEPEEGQKRIIFAVDPAEERQLEIMGYRLQLIPGRNLVLPKRDAVNIRSFDGKIQANTVEGWGFEYYTVHLSDQAINTHMMYTGDDGDEQVRKFVPIARPKLVRYNSNAPVVVYLPKDADLRYSVWTAGDEMVAERE